ncbi:hypothetical protein B484DRAFT_458795 [Ochromonadaceae sp. CCMP2298]|jgi:hypothetical protein|nr:hypothetical protein B484DRAFT_458795 [Ochromonadaceae sp. CCMP2298]
MIAYLPLFFLALLASVQAETTDMPCVSCRFSSKNCSLLAPADAKWPCYQGSPADSAACLATDPLLKEGTTWSCGNCEDMGFPKYLTNDPIYKNMELWV